MNTTRKQVCMSNTEFRKHPIQLSRSAFNELFQSPAIFFPFSVLAFVQLLILEIFFFAPRFPLSGFFGPIINKFAGSKYLIYPNNYILLDRWFNHWSVQGIVFVFLGSFFIGVAILIINSINNEGQINLPAIYKETWQRYVHLWCAALTVFSVIFFFSFLYGLIYKRALLIRSTSGGFFFIKQLVMQGAPLYQLLIALFSLAVFAYIFPIIILEKRGFFSALVLNFKMLWPSFICILLVVIIPALLYIPLLLLKINGKLFVNVWAPEGWGMLMVCLILVTMFIDAWQYTAITTCYILDRESR